MVLDPKQMSSKNALNKTGISFAKRIQTQNSKQSSKNGTMNMVKTGTNFISDVAKVNNHRRNITSNVGNYDSAPIANVYSNNKKVVNINDLTQSMQAQQFYS
jgi:hypothetical protein